jgi:hypothetical protein
MKKVSERHPKHEYRERLKKKKKKKKRNNNSLVQGVHKNVRATQRSAIVEEKTNYDVYA